MDHRNQSKTRVVVTGQGILSPIGNTVEEYWRNLTNGVSGIARITQFDPSNSAVQIAGEVKGFEPGDYMDEKAARRMSRFAQFAVAAARMALDDARFTINEDNAASVAVVVGTGGGGIGDVADGGVNLKERGPRSISPFFLPSFIANMGACQVSIQTGARGPVLTNVAACATGILSFGDALRLLRAGEADVAICGSAESAIHLLSFAALNNMGALCKTRNDDPTHASRPFDKNREGFVYSEGAGVMILETLEHALARDARIIAELIGAAATGDAYHVSAPAPNGIGASTAMSRALQNAGLAPQEVDYVVAHGTGTQLNDVSETAAIKTSFGEYAYKLMISSPKSMVGHLLGAAGAMSGTAAIMSIRDGVVPPTTNLDTPDPECDLDYVPNVKREANVRIAMANGFGFGGQNGVAVFKAFEG